MNNDEASIINAIKIPFEWKAVYRTIFAMAGDRFAHSYATIARLAGTNLESAGYAMRHLVACGVVEVVKQNNGAHPKEYRLHRDRLDMIQSAEGVHIAGKSPRLVAPEEAPPMVLHVKVPGRITVRRWLAITSDKAHTQREVSEYAYRATVKAEEIGVQLGSKVTSSGATVSTYPIQFLASLSREENTKAAADQVISRMMSGGTA